MVGLGSVFPTKLDVFPQFVDGIHPDVPEDWNHLTNVLTQIEKVLGPNPSGAKIDIATRIDKTIDEDGFFKGIQLIVSTISIAQFKATAGNGVTVPFLFTMPDAFNSCFIASLTGDTIQDGGVWSQATVDQAYLEESPTAAHCIWRSYDRKGFLVDIHSGDVTFATLVVNNLAAV